MNDAIAILGWGSLIWHPATLKIAGRWHCDGPELPIEFARISDNKRATLVIHLGSPLQRTYWANSACESVEEARENLREREETKRVSNIHWLTAAGDGSGGQIEAMVRGWLTTHADIGAVVWTGLESNWAKRGHFSVDDAVEYLRTLESTDAQAAKRAREYVCNAPPQIQTEVRRRMRAIGWHDAAPTLFEDVATP